MRAGISTACLYPMHTEESLKQLIELNFKYFEIFFNTYSEISFSFLRGLKKLLDENGCKVKSVHPFTSGFETMLLFSDYKRRYLDGIEFYKQYCQAANLLGASILVLHGERDYHKARITEEEYIERYKKLREMGKEQGIDIAQENVNAFRSEDPAFIRRMRKSLQDDCSFVFDIKQAVRAGVDPFDMCDAMGKRLCHLHFNDNTIGKDCLLPGKGSMSFKLLRNKLEDYGFCGDIIIEVYRKNFGKIDELQDAKKFTENFVSGII